jgi:hypothetical protein
MRRGKSEPGASPGASKQRSGSSSISISSQMNKLRRAFFVSDSASGSPIVLARTHKRPADAAPPHGHEHEREHEQTNQRGETKLKPVALLLIGVGVILLGMLVTQIGRSVARGARVPAVAVSRDLQVGHTLEPGDLLVINVPADSLPPDAIVDPQSAIGRTMCVPVVEGQVLFGALVSEREQRLTVAEAKREVLPTSASGPKSIRAVPVLSAPPPEKSPIAVAVARSAVAPSVTTQPSARREWRVEVIRAGHANTIALDLDETDAPADEVSGQQAQE